MNQEKIKKLKAAATDCHGWSWPDRNKADGTHQFGKRDEDGNFNEVGTIDASNYTGDYADDIKVLKFIRAAQPTIILELIALAESALLAAAPVPIQQEPVGYEYRAVANNLPESRRNSWVRCTKAAYESYKENPFINNVRWEVRELYAATPPALAGSQVQAAGDVLAERERQKQQEGWTDEHDDQYEDGELCNAAACYTMANDNAQYEESPNLWPWPEDWWKPTTERRNLVKAGALILAEIERLDRAAMREQP